MIAAISTGGNHKRRQIVVMRSTNGFMKLQGGVHLYWETSRDRQEEDGDIQGGLEHIREGFHKGEGALYKNRPIPCDSPLAERC